MRENRASAAAAVVRVRQVITSRTGTGPSPGPAAGGGGGHPLWCTSSPQERFQRCRLLTPGQGRASRQFLVAGAGAGWVVIVRLLPAAPVLVLEPRALDSAVLRHGGHADVGGGS
ncbi:hypothetical protein GGE06_001922 [Streptomyces sp. SFB5A]|uniref:Uncharacterized protein n=1 Tax=Streptomyces nymphaeiformis TaxID=2663842 RepID=A0A7W7TX66_9ACTN|nr:hypothetical protein [Streptomyces nymphaeiformis]